MSIIIAAASRMGGVVASDGRQFGSATLDNGRVVRPAQIESDRYDKTFLCCNDRVIGAVAGLQRFSGKTVGEHVAEITTTNPVPASDTNILGDVVETFLTRRLEAVDSTEVIFECRKLDLLLVECVAGRSAVAKIIALHFEPCNGRIVTERKVVSQRRGFGWYTFGDDQAQAAAKPVLSTPTDSAIVKVPVLVSVVRRAVIAGIESCGQHPHSAERSCGGEVFVRAVRCQNKGVT